MLITLPLYLLRELAKAIGLALFVFSFIFLAFFVGSLIRDGVGVVTALLLLPRLFPFISPFVLPFAIITGTLVCYARFASSNEFTATQAGGIHPMWVAAPALAVAILASTITIFLNADVLTAARHSIQRALVSEKTGILRERLSRPGSFTFQSVAFSRLSRDEQGRAAVDITFFGKGKPPEGEDVVYDWHPDYPHQAIRLLARDHRILIHESEGGALMVEAKVDDVRRYDLTPQGVQTFQGGSGNPQWGARDETEIGLSGDRVSYWGIRELVDRRREKREEAAALLEAMERDPERVVDPNAVQKHLKSIRKYSAALHLKLAMSFACIAFGLVGVPLGLLIRHGSATVGFAVGILVAMLFFVVEKTFATQVEDGHLSVPAMWLPNMALLGLGVFLWFRAQRMD